MKRIVQSILSASLAIVLFNAIYFLGRGAMYFFDTLRGLDGDFIQGIGMEIIIPYFGGYIAASTSREKFDDSVPKINMIIYSIMFLLIFFFVYINLTPFYLKNSEGIRTFLLCILPFAGIIGAIFGFMKNTMTFGKT